MRTYKRHSTVFRTLHYFWTEIKRHKWSALFTFVAAPVVYAIRNIYIPYVFAEIINEVSLGTPFADVVQVFAPKIIFATFLHIIAIALHQLRNIISWKFELKVIYELNDLAFDTISAQSMQFYSDRFSGSLVSQVNKFTDSFERFFDIITWNILPFFFNVLFILVMLATISPLVSFILLLSAVMYMFVAWLTYRKMIPLHRTEAETYNQQTGQLADSVTNIVSVKSYAREGYEQKRFNGFQRKHISAIHALLHADVTRNSVFDIIGVIMIALLMLILMGGQEWFGFTVGSMILIITYARDLLGQLWEGHSIFKSLNRVFGDAHEMTEILDMKDDVVDAEDAQPLKITHAEINFSDITFKHAEAKSPIFTNFDLKINPGERVGLVGVSGSGKTTLTKLLLRFADVQTGEISIDGQDIKTITQESLRKNIAYVPQETALFHRSIAENIAYGKPDATKQEIERAAKLANAHEFIKDLPSGYDTLVGERGIKLSGGQRQRIAIARAILKNAPMLVLDEATSALDSESESLIQDALIKLMKDRTSIVIAHRLSTVANLDRIVVLENGKIAEQGTHQELLSKNGAYARLWSRQSGAFLDEGDHE